MEQNQAKPKIQKGAWHQGVAFEHGFVSSKRPLLGKISGDGLSKGSTGAGAAVFPEGFSLADAL